MDTVIVKRLKNFYVITVENGITLNLKKNIKYLFMIPDLMVN